MRRRPSRELGRHSPFHTPVRVNQLYDLVSDVNGLIMGHVVIAFQNPQWHFVIKLHNDMPAYGVATGEYEPFDLKFGEAPWMLPIHCRNAANVTAISPITPELPNSCKMICEESTKAEGGTGLVTYKNRL